MHLGSLLAAVAGFLDARLHGGRWLLRIDDLDQPRVRPGACDEILRQLTNFGLEWDGPIRHQSTCDAEYRHALNQIATVAPCFRCDCTRRLLRAAPPEAAADDGESGCLGDCRTRRIDTPAALRLDLKGLAATGFSDRWQGWVDTPPVADRILCRRDGLIAYNLAVLVDDYATGVTDVVRGADLLSSTPAQMAIARLLGQPVPRYAHAPLLVEAGGGKLAKSRNSVAIGDQRHVRHQLVSVLRLLSQDCPAGLEQVQVRDILDYAINHWAPERFAGCRSIPLAPEGARAE